LVLRLFWINITDVCYDCLELPRRLLLQITGGWTLDSMQFPVYSLVTGLRHYTREKHMMVIYIKCAIYILYINTMAICTINPLHIVHTQNTWWQLFSSIYQFYTISIIPMLFWFPPPIKRTAMICMYVTYCWKWKAHRTLTYLNIYVYTAPRTITELTTLFVICTDCMGYLWLFITYLVKIKSFLYDQYDRK
jgi:hypothetical protein